MSDTNMKYIYGFGGIFGLILYSYAASLMFFLLSKQPLELANPLSIWLTFGNEIDEQTGSRLFVALAPLPWHSYLLQVKFMTRPSRVRIFSEKRIGRV